ncbi:unnamed protein product [Rotaria magnacalcarata]|uniref:DUF908 domain-containing protein n=1 Tax=Rotaria magnacalcarata TaxID=392030 RepID=A0A819EEG5_9BILA|nr:unnamed protein product [Rotaria magnacalcarata]
MKIDRSESKKCLPEPPADCKFYIDKVKSCDRKELHELLKPIIVWHIGKCELYHWIDVLNLFDSILEEACTKIGRWMLSCDEPGNGELKTLVLDILHFTTLLIEHSYSRHIYNSTEYLIMLLQSSDLHIVLGVLSLLYILSKHSSFITRLQIDRKQAFVDRLIFLADTWGGRENGFDLARCCSVRNPSDFPEYATNLHFTYTVLSESTPNNGPTVISYYNETCPRLIRVVLYLNTVSSQKKRFTFSPNRNLHNKILFKQIDIPNVHLTGINAAAVMEMILAEHPLCIQARLHALLILIYSSRVQEANCVLYDGLIQELVEVLNVRDSSLTDIKVSALKTLTSIIHLERTTKHPPCLQEITETTQINSYYGFLPSLVR